MAELHDDPVADAYDRWAATYDTDTNRTRDLAGEILRQIELELSGRHVVELGCGTGRNTRWLMERSHHVLALDASEGMLERARSQVAASHVRFIRHDVREPWPVEDGAVDIVVATLVLEHVSDLAAVCHEAARVLRVGGDFFICELHPARQYSGAQARFQDHSTGEQVHVPAHLHDVSDYVNGSLGAGFDLVRLREWRDPGTDRPTLPRLLSVHMRRRAEQTR